MRNFLIFILIFFAFSFNVSVFAENDNPDIVQDTTRITDVDNSDEENNSEDNPKNDPDNNLNNENSNEEVTPSDDTDILPEYAWKADMTEVGENSLNVQSYLVEESEKELMYDAETVLRRDNSSGDAWIVYEIPYMEELYAVSYHLASDVAYFSFEISKNGEEWTSLDTEITETVSADRWTKVEYFAENIENVRYIKVVWGVEQTTVNWWNPYFGGLSVNVGSAIPTEIVILTDEKLYIPMYDSITYTLEAEILDQAGIKYESEILWEIIPEENTGDFAISDEGAITVSSDMNDGFEFTVMASAIDGQLLVERTFILVAAMPGDTDGDNVITDIDIAEICANYGKEATNDNRLCDVDKNGLIDIIDLTYAARYIAD